MTTEADLKKAVEDAKASFEAARSDVEKAQKAIRPAINDQAAAERAFRAAEDALKKFQQENVTIDEFEVVEIDPEPFFAVQYTGPEMIPALHLWLRKHTDSGAEAYPANSSGRYDNGAWVGTDEDRDLVRPGGFVVVQHEAYPPNVQILRDEQEFSLFFKRKEQAE